MVWTSLILMLYCVLGFNVVRITYILTSLQDMFELNSTDDIQHMLKQVCDKYTNTTFFFSANYIKIAETKSSVSTCIHLEFCLFVCTNYQLDIHQYHLCNVMVKLTFFLTLKWNIKSYWYRFLKSYAYSLI